MSLLAGLLICSDLFPDKSGFGKEYTSRSGRACFLGQQGIDVVEKGTQQTDGFFRIAGCLACFFLFVGCLAGLFYEQAA